MSDHVIRRGLDVPVQGAANGAVIPLDPPDTVAYSPQELGGLVPRLVAREGDEVKLGSVLFHDKKHSGIVVRSPVAGVVKEVRRGPRRVITDVIVERRGDGVEELKRYTAQELTALDRDAAIAAALATGMWPALRTRPLDRVPNPEVKPQSILIGGYESGPLQLGADVLLQSTDADALQAAINLLSKIAPVHLAKAKGVSNVALDEVSGATTHTFAGPHPAGDMGLQVNYIDPPRGTNRVWTIRAWDAVLMGRALLEGVFPAERIYASVGVGCKPRIVKTLLGAPLAHIVGEETQPSRWIRGSVLTGDAVDKTRWASFTARTVHVLPEDVPRYLFGWALPALGAWSFYRAFLSGFTGKPAGGVYLRPGLFGGERAIVPIGAYERVVATPDILPEFLFKAIISGDLEESIQLGMLDITKEEAALCTYICPSKVEFDVILQKGLDLYEREA